MLTSLNYSFNRVCYQATEHVLETFLIPALVIVTTQLTNCKVFTRKSLTEVLFEIFP